MPRRRSGIRACLRMMVVHKQHLGALAQRRQGGVHGDRSVAEAVPGNLGTAGQCIELAGRRRCRTVWPETRVSLQAELLRLLHRVRWWRSSSSSVRP